MHSKDLERLIDSFERSTLLELKYTQGNTKVHLGRRQQAPASTTETPLQPAATVVVPAPAAPLDEHLIAAPMAGIVYLRPSPTKPDFTSVGSQVSEGDTLAVIEADLWKLGQLMPGRTLRFELTDIDAALSAGAQRHSLFETTATQWR